MQAISNLSIKIWSRFGTILTHAVERSHMLRLSDATQIVSECNTNSLESVDDDKNMTSSTRKETWRSFNVDIVMRFAAERADWGRQVCKDGAREWSHVESHRSSLMLCLHSFSALCSTQLPCTFRNCNCVLYFFDWHVSELGLGRF